jgi:hypothetical protein
VSEIRARGKKQMSRASIRMVLVVTVVLAAFIIDSTAFAMTAREQCTKAFKTCSKRCSADDFSMFCDCVSRYDSCLQRHPPKSSSTSTTTNTPSKGKGLQDPLNVGGDKQVGGGTKLKDRIGQYNLDLGGAQKIEQSGTTSGMHTITRTKKR